jgi:hypothetical protein
MIFVDSWAWIALADKDRGGQTSSSQKDGYFFPS